MLEIKDLCVSIENKQVIDHCNLTVEKGSVHAIMGPNGAGKSTLANVLMGHPLYEVTSGSICLNGQEIQDLEPEERAHLGMFLSFQYPLEIEGLSNQQFLFYSINACRKARGKTAMSQEVFEELLDEKMAFLKIPPTFKDRSVNEGFSGGEKKRNEILQMSLLDPSLMILDETDSGLDIDALRVISKGLLSMRSPDKAQIIVTHYKRLLEYVRPDFVHVFYKGKVVLSGGYEIADKLEKEGYKEWEAIK